MKRQIFLAALILSSIISFGQNEKYTKAMEQLVPSVDTSRTADGLSSLANSFQRIADAEKNQWLPYYYAAYSTVTSAYIMSQSQMGLAEKTDPLSDKAEALLNKAEELSKNNSEIYIVRKMIATLRLLGDPMSRYQTYGPIADEALQNAKKLNPENPRVYLLEGQDKLFTPEEYGGSKTEGKALLEEAVKKFEAFKPETKLHPTWGLQQAKFFISQTQ